MRKSWWLQEPIAILAAVLFMALPLAKASVAAESDTYVLRYSDLGPPRGPRAEALMWWAAEVEKRTNGRVQFDFFWSQSLVKARETLKAVGSGLADAGSIFGVLSPAEFPLWNLANAPFGGGDIWVGMRTWHELRQVRPELRAEAARQNVRILLNFSSGPVDIVSKRPILSASDLQGKKIRAVGGWAGLLKNLGAVPVNLGFGEIYQALDRGTIDGAINYIPFVKSYKHYEVAGHLSEVQMGQLLGYGAGINLDLWRSMPDDIKQVFTDIGVDFIDYYAQAYLEEVDQTRKELAAGIEGKKFEFHAVPEEELERWAARSTFVDEWLEKMAARNIDGKPMLQDLNRVRAKYVLELESKGHPWTRQQ